MMSSFFFEIRNVISKSPETILYSLFFFALTGALFFIFYIWSRSGLLYLKIQQKFPRNSQVLLEIKYSILTALIFLVYGYFAVWISLEGYGLVYRPIDKYGYLYVVLSLLLMIIVHDAYFYWTHRLLHWKPLFKNIHFVHHLSHNPTPFSAYSFHPVEALIQGAIVPLVLFIIPYNPVIFGVFMMYSLLLNVNGHMGFELLPRICLKGRFLRWHNTATHHNMHHQYAKYNFGLYFNVWDRLMNTNHPEYRKKCSMLEQQISRGQIGTNQDIHDSAGEIDQSSF